MSQNDDILDQVFQVIQSRKNADPSKSYVASLYQKGRHKIAEKVGEEAIETVIAAVGGDNKEVIAESADLIFHLMILLAELDLTLDDVRDELARREGISGIDEKNSRSK
ncbi:MAG: phosphoribosyl-ATP diphosphatase [Alphaproteobacteria bacterium]|nr:MAG: phosphoribosyl-ATP diphosphatase [Alphaproteobacteria bacterium]